MDDVDYVIVGAGSAGCVMAPGLEQKHPVAATLGQAVGHHAAR